MVRKNPKARPKPENIVRKCFHDTAYAAAGGPVASSRAPACHAPDSLVAKFSGYIEFEWKATRALLGARAGPRRRRSRWHRDRLNWEAAMLERDFPRAEQLRHRF